jgi:tetratricopeptide (TPR) repeat protein
MILRRSARPPGFSDDEVAAALAEREARRQSFSSPTLHPEEVESSVPVLPPIPEPPEAVAGGEPAVDVAAEAASEAVAAVPEPVRSVPSFMEESPTVAAVPAMPVLQMPSPPLDVSSFVDDTMASVVVAPSPVGALRTSGLSSAASADIVASVPSPTVTRYRYEEGEHWSEAIDVLLKQARSVGDDEKGRLIAEAGHICFSRLNDLDRAGRLFEEASALGYVEPRTLKAFGDVAASNGDLDKFLGLLLKRADLTTGAASAEALQDAVLVERKRLRGEKGTAELVSLLRRSMQLVPGDWFALRLLREMERRQENWDGLLVVLQQMADLASGSRAARIMVERGRIFEDELNQLGEAEKCYAAAREIDASLTSAFLAAERVARLRGDNKQLSGLYQEESARLGEGPDAAFWMARAARAASLMSGQEADTTGLYQRAIEMAGPADRPLRHEAQRFYTRTQLWSELISSIQEEAGQLEGAERSFVLYRLGRVQEERLQDTDAALAAYMDSATADAAAGPAVEAVSRLLTEQGRWEKLRAFLAEVVVKVDDPHIAVTHHYRLAELSEGPLNDQQSAREYYEQILAVDEGYLPALEGLERVYTRLSDWGKLASVYEQRALLAEDERGAALQLHRAAAVFEFRLAQMGQARALYERALARVPDFPASLDALVRILETEGEWGALAKALADAASASSDPNEVVSLAYRAARVYTERVPDSHAEAVGCLERCLGLQPGFLPAIALLRELSERSGDWGRVYLLHRQEADGASDTERRHWRMLAAAEAAERSDAASPLHVLEEILTEDSTHAGAFSALEEQALQGGDLNTLLAVYQRMLVSVPDAVVRSSVGARLAAIARESGDIVMAVQAIGEVIAAEGERPLLALSRIAESLNHWEKARDALSASGGSLSEQARLLESYGGAADACADA